MKYLKYIMSLMLSTAIYTFIWMAKFIFEENYFGAIIEIFVGALLIYAFLLMWFAETGGNK